MVKLISWFRWLAILTIFGSYISFIFFNGDFQTHIMMVIFALGILQFFTVKPPDISQVFVSLFDNLEKGDDDDFKL